MLHTFKVHPDDELAGEWLEHTPPRCGSGTTEAFNKHLAHAGIDLTLSEKDGTNLLRWAEQLPMSVDDHEVIKKWLYMQWHAGSYLHGANIKYMFHPPEIRRLELEDNSVDINLSRSALRILRSVSRRQK